MLIWRGYLELSRIMFAVLKDGTFSPMISRTNMNEYDVVDRVII